MATQERYTDTVALRKYMAEKGYKTIRSLSDASGINRNTLGKVLDGNEQPSADVMAKLVFTLGIPTLDAGSIFFARNLPDE